MTGKEKLQCEVVKGLAKEGVSALVIFHVEKGLTGADSEVIETAEQVGLLIVIPKNNKAEYSDAIEQIMDKLLYGDNFKNSLINNTIYHLLNFEKHKTFQAALRGLP